MTNNRLATPVFPPVYRTLQQSVLEGALATVPAYRSWRNADPGASAPIDVRYAALPALTKADLRRHRPEGFVPDDRDVAQALAADDIEYVATSGSTSDAVINLWCQEWWDASEAASWKLNAVTARAGLGEHREAILSSPLCVGFARADGYLSMEERTLHEYLFLCEKADPSEWTPQLCDRMLEELCRFEPVLLEANPSFLDALCRYAIAHKSQVFQPVAVVLTYENPSLIHLRHIRQVFGCPVISSYGTTECGYVFMQCEAGRFHQNTEHCHIDFQPLKPVHGGPMVGRILVTTFHNPWRSLLRFDVGDLVRLAAAPCPCGRREGLTLDAIEGRAVNSTIALNGRLVTQRSADAVMATIEGVDQYTLVQTGQGAYSVRYVSTSRDPAAIEPEIAASLRGLYGSDAQVSAEPVAAISPELSVKYRLTKADFEIKIEGYLEQ
jgi:phenylacetate-coenzyme A ligase PaaK-like adenylate-forming protein